MEKVQDKSFLDASQNAELSERIEDTRAELVVSMMQGSGRSLIPRFILMKRVERLVDDAIEYIYYDET